jgi:hypothetical protein
MAVVAAIGAPAGAINYTFTTDTSADWASVANSTYFYNKADKLVRFKNAGGVILQLFAGANVATQVATTSFNQYAVPVGLTNTMIFSANVISTLGQIIDIDFLARGNTANIASLRIYINNVASLVGATQIGNSQINSVIDSMLRYQHRFTVTNDGAGNWNIIGTDAFGVASDLVTPNLLFNPFVVGVGLPTKSYILVSLTQGASLIAASISY